MLQELATAVEHRLEEAKAALQLAALRGVDVRILIPGMADHWMFRYVHDAFLPEVDQAFCEDVAEMLERDFSRSTPVEASDIGELGIRSKLATEVTRLLAPTL